MKKFITHTVKNKTSIYECEVFVYQPRPFSLKSGEELFIVTAPLAFKGERWYSMFFRDFKEECLSQIESNIREEYKRQKMRCDFNESECPPLTEEDIAEKLKQVEILFL